MPRPVLLLTLAYGAGLATGLMRFGDDVIVGAVLLLPAVFGHRQLAGLLAGAALLGRLSAASAWRSEADTCAARLPAESLSLQAIVAEPVDGLGGLTEIVPEAAGCTGKVTARWPVDHAADAGVRVRLTGRWIRRPGPLGRPSGTLVVSEVVVPQVQAPGLSPKIRSWIWHSISALYGARAPIVHALILNRRGAMDPAMRDRYAQSGLVHILSISGFHVGLIVAWVWMACRALGLRARRALALASGVSVAYVGFLGWPAPATRAAALAVLLAICQVRQRRVQPDAMLAVTCLIVLLADPWAIADLGAWLSAASLWGATTFSRWSDRALGAGFWWRTLASSVGATVATAPITAATLGSVALVGVVLNFLAIPLAAAAVPGVLASLVVVPVWPALAGAFATGAGLALSGLDLIATGGAAVPGGHIIQPAGVPAGLPWLGLLAAALWGVHHRPTAREAGRRWLWAATAGGWLWLVAAVLQGQPDKGSNLTLHFLNVGQGDGAAIRTPGGHWVVIDAGPKSERDDAGRRIMLPFLARQRVRSLSVLVVSHAHADHLGGVGAVLERIPAQAVVEPGDLVTDPLYLGLLEELQSSGIPWRVGRPGTHFELDGVRFTLLHPDTAWADWGEDLNEDSIVLRVEYGAFQALFPGDAGLTAERHLRGAIGAVDLLKVGHHGSRTATGQAWLRELRPKAAVISVGVNRYGHPSPEALDRLGEAHVSVWRTDREGEIVVTTDGATMTIRGRRGTETYSTR